MTKNFIQYYQKLEYSTVNSRLNSSAYNENLKNNISMRPPGMLFYISIKSIAISPLKNDNSWVKKNETENVVR